MERIRKTFIAIAYIVGYHAFKYVLYDYYKKNVVILSEKAVSLIIDSVINLAPGDDFINHLSSIWCIRSKSEYNPNGIEVEIKNARNTKLQEDYTIVKFKNIMHKDNETKVVLFDRVKIDDDASGEVTYNICKASISTEDKNDYSIKIYNIVGFDFDKTDLDKYNRENTDILSNNEKIFMRNTVKVNNTTKVKEIVAGIQAKRKLANMYDNNISLYETMGRIYLMGISIENKEETVKIPRQIDGISYRVTLMLLDCINTKGIKVVLNEKQYNSMIYCVGDKIDKFRDSFIIRE